MYTKIGVYDSDPGDPNKPHKWSVLKFLIYGFEVSNESVNEVGAASVLSLKESNSKVRRVSAREDASEY